MDLYCITLLCYLCRLYPAPPHPTQNEQNTDSMRHILEYGYQLLHWKYGLHGNKLSSFVAGGVDRPPGLSQVCKDVGAAGPSPRPPTS